MRLRLSFVVVCMCVVESVELLVGVFITPQTPFELRQAFRNSTRDPRVRLVFFVGIEGNFSEEQRVHRDIVQGICPWLLFSSSINDHMTQVALTRI